MAAASPLISNYVTTQANTYFQNYSVRPDLNATAGMVSNGNSDSSHSYASDALDGVCETLNPVNIVKGMWEEGKSDANSWKSIIEGSGDVEDYLKIDPIISMNYKSIKSLGGLYNTTIRALNGDGKAAGNLGGQIILVLIAKKAGSFGAIGKGGAIAEGSFTKVFRAVDATEANAIRSTGKFSLQVGGVESKYFAQSLKDVHSYGKAIYPQGYTIFEATVKAPVNASQYWFPYIDGMGAYVFPAETLQYIIPKL